MKKQFLGIFAAVLFYAVSAFGQTYILDMQRESARSDKLTGGEVAKAPFVSGNGDIRITINVPAFQMTLWQNGKEVRSYPIGIGMLEFPLPISLRQATSIEWNPVWIPPSSDWIEQSSTVKAGEIVQPTDPRNPLGKVKIPLGYGYLIHQAKGWSDMGGLVSHGCVRVMQSDLYDLAEKIVAALGLAVTPQQIDSAKQSKKTLVVPIDAGLPVEITYDTMVVEGRTLRIYPDVYENKKNTVENLRTELRTSGVDDSRLSDTDIQTMIAAAKGKNQFVVKAADIVAGNALQKGRVVSVVPTPTQKRASPRGPLRKA